MQLQNPGLIPNPVHRESERMAGRKAEPLIKRLTAECEGIQRGSLTPREEDISDPRVILLRQCLLDEVQVRPPTLRGALRQVARHGCEVYTRGSVVNLRRGKFRPLREMTLRGAVARLSPTGSACAAAGPIPRSPISIQT